MKGRIYLETTIPSYLTAWPSRDLVRAAHQQITRDWWDKRRTEFELYISQIVVQECQAGDETAAAERMKVLQDLPLLEQTEEAMQLAQALVDHVPLPKRAAVDALHVALAAVHGMDYLLTWNCTHIANATLREPIESVCRANGYDPPAICTPDQLLAQEGD
jgi:PIN domain